MTDMFDATNDAVIARMRSALDEVAAGLDTDRELVPAHSSSPTPRRWLGIAAATVLLAGAATFALTRRSSNEPTATSDATTTTTPAVPTVDPSAIWYALSAPGFTADAVEQQAVIEGPSNPVVTWVATTGATDGVLALTQYFNGELGAPRSTEGETVVNAADGSQWQVQSYGMALERREALIARIVPGSGVPFVLDDPAMRLLSIGDLGPATDAAVQTYWNGDDWATITVGTDRGVGRGLATSIGLQPTRVDGFDAYRSVHSDGTVEFVWSFAPGRWAMFVVSAGLSDRADEIAASLTRAPLPPFEPARPDTTPTTIVSDPVAPSTTLLAAQPDIPWFAITSPDVTLGDVQHRDPLPVDQQQLTQSWIVDGSDGRGFVTVGIAHETTPGVEGDYTVEDLDLGNGVAYFLQPNGSDNVGPVGYGFELRWFRDDGDLWLFQSQGLTRDQLVAAVSAAVPGSGVPIVIADPTFTTMTVGVVAGEQYVQAEPADKGQIHLWVEHDGQPLGALITTADIADVTVAGMPGYKGQMAGGQVSVAWDAGTGWWGHLWLGTDLAPNADAIIASIIPAMLPDNISV